MIAPRVHLNGDRKDVLLENIHTAYSAITLAQKALQETVPNARNYYVISPEAFEQAREEHRSRALKLQRVLDELVGMAAAIEDGEIQFTVKERS